MENTKIWCVFNPSGGAPRHTHYSKKSAVQESKRLARINPEVPFYVMESIGVAKKVEVEYQKLNQIDYEAEFRVEDLPF